MTKPKKSKHRRKGNVKRKQAAAARRPADVLTVFWMLSTFAVIVAECILVFLRFCQWLGATGDVTKNLTALMFFISLVTGIITLLATWFVLKFGTARPPKSIVVTSIVCGLIPIGIVILALILNSQR